jgi:hypothetical protein
MNFLLIVNSNAILGKTSDPLSFVCYLLDSNLDGKPANAKLFKNRC